MNWTDPRFMSSVLPWAPGVPPEVAADHLIRAARSFCEGTHVWNYETDPVILQAGVDRYPIDLDSDEELLRILNATIDGREIGVFDTTSGRRNARAQCGGRFMWNEGLDAGVYPVPTMSTGELRMQVSVKPALTATEWPDELSAYADDIAHGALASLLTMPNVPWKDPNTAVVQANLFSSRIANVGFKVARGFTPNRARVGNRLL